MSFHWIRERLKRLNLEDVDMIINQHKMLVRRLYIKGMCEFICGLQYQALSELFNYTVTSRRANSFCFHTLLFAYGAGVAQSVSQYSV
jgi:hypothetical protein